MIDTIFKFVLIVALMSASICFCSFAWMFLSVAAAA